MRTIGKILLLLSPIFLRFQCEKGILEDTTGKWYIKNCTDQTLVLHFPPYRYSWFNIEIGDSLSIGSCTAFYTDSPSFDYWQRDVARYHKYEDIYLEVFSKSNTLLRTWNFLDKDLSGKQLFKESSWRYYQLPYNNADKGSTYTYLRNIWVFEILPEDLTTDNND